MDSTDAGGPGTAACILEASLGRDNLAISSGAPQSLFALGAKGTLAIGDSGPDVARLQQALRLFGYYKEATNTAAFGWVTSEAVKAFQRDYGLPMLGEVNVSTRKAIADALAGKGGQRAPVLTPPAGSTWQPPAVAPRAPQPASAFDWYGNAVLGRTSSARCSTPGSTRMRHTAPRIAAPPASRWSCGLSARRRRQRMSRISS